MNRLFPYLYIMLAFLLVFSCTNAGGVTSPPVVVPDPDPDPEFKIYTLKGDLIIDPSATNYYNDTSKNVSPTEEGDGGDIGGGDSTGGVDNTLSPVEVRLGDKVYVLEELKNGILFTNYANDITKVRLSVSVNENYNIFIGGPTSLYGVTTASLELDITKNTGIVVWITNKPITTQSLTVRKYGKGSLFVSGDEVLDSEEIRFIFPKDYKAKILPFPHVGDGVVYYSITDGIKIDYPSVSETILPMTSDRSITYKLGRANLPWDGYTYEEIIPNPGGNVYEVRNPYELVWVAEQANNQNNNFSGKIIKLMHDLDLNNREFEGIARRYTFSGNIDGDGKIIKNLKMVPTSNSIVTGLVGQLGRGGSISNLTLYGYLEGTNDNVGSFVGMLDVGASISNVTNYVNIISTKTAAATGGVVGTANGGTITYSVNYGIISGYSNVGGIVGRSSTAVVSHSYNTTNIFGEVCVGGIVGSNNNNTIKFTYNAGNIFSTIDYTGGITGYNNNGNVSASYNTAVIEGNNYVGGIEGYRNTTAGPLSYTYSIGNVKVRASSPKTGALIGFSAIETKGDLYLTTMEYSYALQTAAINPHLKLIFDDTKHENGTSAFKDEAGMANISYDDPLIWKSKTFTSGIINGVGTRSVLVGVGEGM